MNYSETLTGRYALLPSEELVVIDTVHDDGYASLRRIEGELAGRVAVCKMTSLQILDEGETHVGQEKAQETFLK
jgi:hypothetical protein